MLLNIINHFKALNSRNPVSFDSTQNHYCKLHCISMVEKGIYHAEDYLLNGWNEIVAKCNYNGDYCGTLNRLVFDIVGTSEEHRNILLNSRIVGYFVLVWNDEAYLTIRTK